MTGISAKTKFSALRLWWVMLGLIILVSGLLRYTGYNFSLPYIDHPDEPSYTLAARMVIDSGSPKPLGMQGYPPGIIALNYLALNAFQDPAEPPTTVIWIIRLLSITASLFSVIVIALLGRLIANPLAGIFGAAMWAFTPFVIEHSRYATPDSFVTFFTLLAIWLTVAGTIRDDYSRTVAGVFSIMLAVIFKYQAIFILPLLLFFPLYRLRFIKDKASKKGLWIQWGKNALRIGAFLFWLIFLFPALQATESPYFDAAGENLALPTLPIMIANLLNIMTTVAPIEIWILCYSGLLLLALRRFRSEINSAGFLFIIAAGVASLIGISFFGEVRLRQLLAFGALLTLMRGIGLALLVAAIGYLIQQYTENRQYRNYAVAGASLILIAIIITPNILHAYQSAIYLTLPDRRNDLARYMDTSLEPAPHIATWDNHKTLNRSWGGYSGIHEFPFMEQASLPDRPVEEWRAMGVLYSIMPRDEYFADSEAMRDYRNETLLLKSYPPQSGYQGPSMVVQRLYPIENKTAHSLGSIQLVGYDINPVELKPGETLTFKLYWQARQPADRSYAVFNHLTKPGSTELVAQADGLPLFDARRSTQEWDDPDEVLVSRDFVLQLPDNIQPGIYQLSTGFYDPDSGARLESPEGNDRIVFARLRVLE